MNVDELDRAAVQARAQIFHKGGTDTVGYSTSPPPATVDNGGGRSRGSSIIETRCRTDRERIASEPFLIGEVLLLLEKNFTDPLVLQCLPHNRSYVASYSSIIAVTTRQMLASDTKESRASRYLT